MLLSRYGQDVLNAEIRAELKAVILENLRRIENAINDYDVRGVDGLQETSILVALNVKGLEPEKEKPVWKYVQRLAQITTILIGLAKGASAMMPLLPDVHDTYEKIIHMVPAEPEPPPAEGEPEAPKSNDIQQI